MDGIVDFFHLTVKLVPFTHLKRQMVLETTIGPVYVSGSALSSVSVNLLKWTNYAFARVINLMQFIYSKGLVI